MYIFGGSNGTTYHNELYVLDLNTYHWTKPEITTKIQPGARRAHAAVTVGKKIYFIGGGNGKEALNETWLLDTTQLTWELLKCSGTLPAPRGYCSHSLYIDKIYIYGGSDGNECFSGIFCLDISTLVWSKKKINTTAGCTVSCFSQSASMIGNSMIVFGGHSANENINELKIVTLDNKMESVEMGYKPCTGIPPQPRSYHTASYLDSRLYIFAGCGDQIIYNDVWVLDLGIYSLLASPFYLSSVVNSSQNK